MQRLTIRQFRALLAGRAEANTDVRAYRELGLPPRSRARDAAQRVERLDHAVTT